MVVCSYSDGPRPCSSNLCCRPNGVSSVLRRQGGRCACNDCRCTTAVFHACPLSTGYLLPRQAEWQPSDPIVTILLQSSTDILSPFLVEMFNRSLLTASVLTMLKAPYITPLQKKPPTWIQRMYVHTDRFQTCPNCLSVLWLGSSGLLDCSQFVTWTAIAYRACHSTETAVLKAPVRQVLLHRCNSRCLCA